MGTEETKEQQQMYNIFRSCIYIFLIIELVMNLPITSESRATQFVLEYKGESESEIQCQDDGDIPYCHGILADYPLYRITAWPVGRRAWRFCYQPRTLCPGKYRGNHARTSGR